MFRHLLKLVWNRKRANGLLLLEIFFTFIVLVAVGGGAIDLATKLGTPPGFDIARVWRVGITNETENNDFWSPEQTETTATLLREVQAMPGVEAAALAMSAPYDGGRRTSVTDHPERPGEQLEVEVNEVSDDFARVVGLELVAGRFFDASDDGQSWRPLIIDQDLARARYGNADPLGQSFDPEGHKRIVGVVRDYRRSELSARGNYSFERVRVGNNDDRPPSRIVIKVAPGVDASFEEALVRRLHAVAPTWSYEARPLSIERSDFMRVQMAPIATGALVAGFLLLMVALGLTGVLWQSMSRRTREIGLRRAIGASASGIRRQLLTELLILSGLALTAGTVLVIQLPLLVSFLPWRLVLPALLVASGAILLLTLAAGWLPSRLATRLEPADALRYE